MRKLRVIPVERNRTFARNDRAAASFSVFFFRFGFFFPRSAPESVNGISFIKTRRNCAA